MKKYLLNIVLILIILILIFSGCDNVTTIPTTRPSETVSVSAVETPIPVPTPSPTPEPTPSPTVDQKAIEKAIVNQGMTDFLNQQGNFTPESIQNYLIKYKKEKLELGWVKDDAGGFDIQCWFFGYEKVGSYIVIAYGFKGADGKNHVKPGVISISRFGRDSNKMPFIFGKLDDWDARTGGTIIEENSIDGILKQLDVIKGHPVLLNFWVKKDISVINEGVNLFGEGSRSYFEELNSKSDLVEGLLSEVNLNKSVVSEKPRYLVKTKVKITDISSMDDLSNIDISKVPLVYLVSFNLFIN